MPRLRKRGPFRILATRGVYRNRWIRLREDVVIRPDGTRGLFGIVERLSSGVTVLALDKNGEVYLVREYKYGVGTNSLELISGGLDRRETPLQGAKRELREETGLVARTWVACGRIDPLTTILSAPVYLFIAKDLEMGENNSDPGELVHIERRPLSRAVKLVLNGKITHAASCLLLLKAYLALKHGSPYTLSPNTRLAATTQSTLRQNARLSRKKRRFNHQ